MRRVHADLDIVYKIINGIVDARLDEFKKKLNDCQRRREHALS